VASRSRSRSPAASPFTRSRIDSKGNNFGQSTSDVLGVMVLFCATPQAHEKQSCAGSTVPSQTKPNQAIGEPEGKDVLGRSKLTVIPVARYCILYIVSCILPTSLPYCTSMANAWQCEQAGACVGGPNGLTGTVSIEIWNLRYHPLKTRARVSNYIQLKVYKPIFA
jgi:hypothetical protein